MKTLLGAATAAMVLVGAAEASSITVSTLPGYNVFGPDDHKQVVTLDLDGALDGTAFDDKKVYAGQFNLVGDSGFGEFLAFCVDLADGLVLPHGYDITSSLFDTDTQGRLGDLFNTAYDMVDTSLEAAGFQLAVWEIVYDDNPYDLSSGTFAITDNANAASKANQYLNNLDGTVTTYYHLDFLVSQTGQDLVVAAVPLPAAGMMLIGGLGGLAMMRRKRKA